MVCAVPQQGPLQASGGAEGGLARRRGRPGGGGVCPSDLPACPCPALAGALTRAAREARPRSSRPAAVRAGRPPPRGLWASSPRLWGADWDPWAPPAARGSEDVPRRAPSRGVPRSASGSRSQVWCALGLRRWPRPGVPAGRAAGQRRVARGARGRRGLALGASRRRGLQRPGAALPLAALSEPQRPPNTRAPSVQGEQQLWGGAGAGCQGLWALG